MQRYDMEVVCLQEMWVTTSSVKIEKEYSIILSWKRQWRPVMGGSGVHSSAEVQAGQVFQDDLGQDVWIEISSPGKHFGNHHSVRSAQCETFG